MFEQAILGIVDLGKLTDFSQIPAQQGQVMPGIQPPDLSELVRSCLVVEVGDQRIAGVRWHRDKPPLFDQLRSLLEQPGLRIIGVDGEKL